MLDQIKTRYEQQEQHTSKMKILVLSVTIIGFLVLSKVYL